MKSSVPGLCARSAMPEKRLWEWGSMCVTSASKYIL